MNTSNSTEKVEFLILMAPITSKIGRHVGRALTGTDRIAAALRQIKSESTRRDTEDDF